MSQLTTTYPMFSNMPTIDIIAIRAEAIRLGDDDLKKMIDEHLKEIIDGNRYQL